MSEQIQPCPNAGHMGEHACQNKAQCWEPCGELGKSEKHAVAMKPVEAGKLDREFMAMLERGDHLKPFDGEPGVQG